MPKRILTLGRIFVALLSAGATIGCGGANAPREAAKGSAGADACALLSESEIAELVGNPVLKGRPSGGADCKWDTEDPAHVSVLLIVNRKGSVREKVLCGELGKGGEGERLQNVADVATWKFSNAMRFFNSGDLEACGGKGFVSLSLSGKRDEAALKQAGVALARKVFERW